jgi:hypothetical protein
MPPDEADIWGITPAGASFRKAAIVDPYDCETLVLSKLPAEPNAAITADSSRGRVDQDHREVMILELLRGLIDATVLDGRRRSAQQTSS